MKRMRDVQELRTDSLPPKIGHDRFNRRAPSRDHDVAWTVETSDGDVGGVSGHGIAHLLARRRTRSPWRRRREALASTAHDPQSGADPLPEKRRLRHMPPHTRRRSGPLPRPARCPNSAIAPRVHTRARTEPAGRTSSGRAAFRSPACHTAPRPGTNRPGVPGPPHSVPERDGTLAESRRVVGPCQDTASPARRTERRAAADHHPGNARPSDRWPASPRHALPGRRQRPPPLRPRRPSGG